MSKIKVDDKVIVNKDIFRLEEQYETDIRNEGLKPPTPITLEEYQAINWSKWRRQNKLYATKGEEGIVQEVFHDFNGKRWRGGCLRIFAKVKIGNNIKTFRITSLDKI